jgi:hypothetical protein
LKTNLDTFEVRLIVGTVWTATFLAELSAKWGEIESFGKFLLTGGSVWAFVLGIAAVGIINHRRIRLAKESGIEVNNRPPSSSAQAP